MYCTVEHNVRVPRWLWPELHCCPIAENSAEKLKYSGKKNFQQQEIGVES
jgi:hypothetical protein